MRQFIFNSYNEWKTLDLEVVWMAVAQGYYDKTPLRSWITNEYLLSGSKIDIKKKYRNSTIEIE